MNMNKVIILGSTQGAVKAVEEIRAADKTSEIVLLSFDGYYPYDRRHFFDLLNKTVPLNKIFYKTKDFYEKHKVKVILDKKITKIAFKKHKVFIEDQEPLDYDLLVITQPPDYSLPDIKGIHKEGVFTLKKLKEIEQIIHLLPLTDTVAVQSAALQGLKTISFFLSQGKEVLWIFEKQSVFSRWLTSDQKERLWKCFEENRLRVLEGNPIVEMLGDADIKAVRLNSGKVIACPIVIFPEAGDDFRLFAGSPLKINQKICVDRNFKTNVENVLAVDEACGLEQKTKEADLETQNDRLEEYFLKVPGLTLSLFKEPGLPDETKMKVLEKFDEKANLELVIEEAIAAPYGILV